LHEQVSIEQNTTPPAAAGYEELLRRAVAKDPDATVGVVAGLSWSVTDEHELLEFLQRIVDLATTVIGAADGAGVTANVGGAPFTAVSTHTRVLTVDTAQYLADDGPCLHALRSGTVVHATLATVRTRWPQFAPTAEDSGFQEFLASPLGEDNQWLGALNLYNTHGAGFTAEDTVLLQLLVSNATRSVQDYARLRAANDLAAQLREAMASRAPIEQAKGILMAAHGIDAHAAFEMLRTRSQHTNTRLHNVATAFLADHTGAPTT
jgi:GAF domain-containing protein